MLRELFEKGIASTISSIWLREDIVNRIFAELIRKEVLTEEESRKLKEDLTLSLRRTIDDGEGYLRILMSLGKAVTSTLTELISKLTIKDKP